MRRTGLIEVPLGMTLRQIIFDIGGGTEKPFKAVQTGGPSGGCLSAEHLDTPVDYEALKAGRFDHGIRRSDRHGQGYLRRRYGPLFLEFIRKKAAVNAPLAGLEPVIWWKF